MAICTVAAISRPRALLALRCADGLYAVLRYDDEWTPSVGDSIDAALSQLGAAEVRLDDGTVRPVTVESLNGSADFARSRLTLTP
jgi:hypothetical protein